MIEFKTTMVGELKGTPRIGVVGALDRSPEIQEIAGECPYCHSRIRIPLHGVYDAHTTIKELRYQLEFFQKKCDEYRERAELLESAHKEFLNKTGRS